MSTKKIKKLDEMILENTAKGSKIIETNITNLTAPGDNYGSQIYKVDIKIQNEDGNVEDLNIVAKQIPESEFFQEIFNIKVTFNIESEFYRTIVPTLHNFQEKNGVPILDVFPKFYGARSNLNGINNEVDKDALMVLENLKVKGYRNEDRYVGFDLQTSKIIIKALAQFHATFLALKLKEPETFEKKIKPYCASSLPQPDTIHIDNGDDELWDVLKQSRLGEKLAAPFRKSMQYMGIVMQTFREPFASLVHRDFWVNNIMVGYKEGTAQSAKFVDFQMYSYDSPVTDLLFFLSTSVQFKVLKLHFDALLRFYHEIFIQTLSDLKCDTSQFCYEKFIEEIGASMETDFGKILFMVIFVVKGPKEGQVNSEDKNKAPKFTAKHLSAENRDCVLWLAEEFYNRNWLNF